MNHLGKILENRPARVLLPLLAASIFMVLPILYSGVPNGNDLPQHYQFALKIYGTVQHGDMSPGWSESSNLGFGDAGLRFYPPFSYYVLALARVLTGDWFYASVLAFWFWFFISGIGAYLWARERFGDAASTFAGVVYIFAPYHANEIYNAFTYAEFAAAAVLPFCFLFVTRICRSENLSDVLGLAACFALLVLTHLPSTVIGSLALLIYTIALLQSKSVFRTIYKLGAAVFAGLLASSYYWMRMVRELSFLRHATDEFTSSVFDFRHNFLLGYFYVPALEYDERLLWFIDLMLLVTLGLVIPGAILFYRRAKTESGNRLYSVLALLVFSVFMATPLSLPLWENIGVLQKVQFPWRWMMLITLSGVIFAAAGFEHLGSAFRSKLRPVALAAIGLLLAGLVFTGTQIMKPANFISQRDFAAMMADLAGRESCECWWPVWSKRQALRNTERVSVTGRDLAVVEWQPEKRSFSAKAGEPQNARIATFYYPHWHAKVNGNEVQIDKDENGAILIPLPRESANVELEFREPAHVRAAGMISLPVWALFGVFAVGLVSRRLRRDKNSPVY